MWPTKPVITPVGRKDDGIIKQDELEDSKDKSDSITGMLIDDKIDKYQEATLFRSICTLLGICDEDGYVK